jgi:hypothetical protein
VRRGWVHVGMATETEAYYGCQVSMAREGFRRVGTITDPDALLMNSLHGFKCKYGRNGHRRLIAAFLIKSC